MKFNYEQFVKDTSIVEDFDYFLAGLVEEVGEVARLRRKEIKGTTITSDQYTDELGDVLWYLTALTEFRTGNGLEELAESNRKKLSDKFNIRGNR